MKKVAVFGMTEEKIANAGSKELREFASTAGIKNYSRKSKDELIAELTAVVQNTINEAKAIVKKANAKDSEVGKSEAMRQIFEMGITSPKAISEITGGHYSFVYGVITRMKAAQKEEAAE